MRFGLEPADNNYAVSWLAMLANQPWHGTPLMFALIDHGDHLHPWAMAPIIDENADPVVRPSVLASYIDGFDFSQLPRPEQPIMAVGFMRETYMGERDGAIRIKANAGDIGDHPSDVLVRRCIIAFAGGGRHEAVHIREDNSIGVNDAIEDNYTPGLVDQLLRVMARLNTGELPR